MDENKTAEQQTENAETTAIAAAPQANLHPTMWNDNALLKQAYKAAQYLASSDLVPEQTYKNKPQNCLVALDLANRMGIAPLLVMQNLYIVKGKPAWSGSFCITAVNGCGRFTPLEFVFTGTGDADAGCFARATRISDGVVCTGTTITMQMAKAEGWLDKSGSKWKTMPQQMLQYRAASFFARVFCPDILMGVQTADEIKDVNGYEEQEKPVVTYTL